MATKKDDPGASIRAPGTGQGGQEGQGAPPATPPGGAQPSALGLADRAETEAAVRRAVEAEKATIAAAVARSKTSGTAVLRAPADMTAFSIDGAQYDVVDGMVLVEERHISAAFGIGCTHLPAE